jgi:uncharacterized protein YqjF (DUF2071 family)
VTANDYRAILREVAHRPWPMPETPWVMTQTWHDLLFAHWPVDARTLRAHVPPAFELDVFDGTGWIGVVPFHMTNVVPRGMPSMPGISEFSELNVRTYVRVDGIPGVYFFSLDAGSALAVRAARWLFNLPYFSAAMRVRRGGATIDYESWRERDSRPAVLSVRYRPTGPEHQAIGGSLEYFLAERYCLYNLDRRGAAYRLEIHHPPWPLQRAEAEFVRNTMADAAGLSLPDAQPLLHFSRRQDIVAWMPVAL